MNNHDALILKVILNKKGRIDSNKLKRIERHPNLMTYIIDRYDDSFSMTETLNRIHYNVNVHPQCPVCGNYVSYKGTSNGRIIFAETCSQECANKYKKKERTVKTCLAKYGVTNGGASTQAKEKIKKTCEERYGASHVWKNKDIRKKCQDTLKDKYKVSSSFLLDTTKNTIKSRYGVDNVAKSDMVKERMKRTCEERYGVDHVWKVKDVRKKCLESFKNNTGVSSPSQMPDIAQKIRSIREKNGTSSSSPEIQDRINKTKKERGTFNTSRPEENLHQEIQIICSSVKRQYRDDRYPFNCDFYIPELDMFIELQGTWTHGNHPYNPDSEEDNILLEKWKQKGTKYYDNAIKTWIERDPHKRKIAKDNHLNYVELFNKKDILLFLTKLKTLISNNEDIDTVIRS